MTIKNKIFYNAFIRFSLQSFLKFMIAACTTLSLLDWASGLQQGVISILMIVVLLLLPCLYVAVMYKQFVHLDLPSVKARIGSLYLNMNPEKVTSLAYSIFFLLRRSFFVFLTYALTSYPHL